MVFSSSISCLQSTQNNKNFIGMCVHACVHACMQPELCRPKRWKLRVKCVWYLKVFVLHRKRLKCKNNQTSHFPLQHILWMHFRHTCVVCVCLFFNYRKRKLRQAHFARFVFSIFLVFFFSTISGHRMCTMWNSCNCFDMDVRTNSFYLYI